MNNGSSPAAGALDRPSDGRSRRRYLSSLAGLVGALSLAGCSSDDGRSADSGTPTGTGSVPTPTATASAADTDGPALGDVIENDELAVVAYDVKRSESFETLEVSADGAGHVVVDVAVKNKQESEPISVSSQLGFTLRDDEHTAYDPSLLGPEPDLDGGTLAPGGVTRGFVTFDRVPQDATGLTLEIAPLDSSSGVDGTSITLESDGEGRTLTQDLRVPVSDVGDTTEYRNTRFTANAVRTSTGDEFATPDAGNEFVLVDITVENTGADEMTILIPVQLALQDEVGRTYEPSSTATSSIDTSLSGVTVAAGSKQRGEVGFEVEAGIEPLYLEMDFEPLSLGDEAFYRLR